MHKLFPYFEREMNALRNNMQEATKRYPTLASMLGFSGGQCTDPSAQRVMEGTALLGAQIARKLDYYHTRLTNDLLGILGPFYLNPIPSCAVACFEPFEKSAVATIPRGTEIRTRAEPICRFRTVCDVTVPAIAISATYTTCVNAPLSLALPPDVGGAIMIAIESSGSRGSLAEAATSPVRVYIDTDTATMAALYDTLFARSLCTCVESQQQWRKLLETPFVPAGFAAADAVLPTPRRQDDSLRLLAEYFAFPDKFDFFDIDLQPVLAQCPRDARRVVLHVLVPDLHHTAAPQLLRALPATALRLACTPIVNMFSTGAESIRVKEGQDTYALTLPRTLKGTDTLYGIDAAKLMHSGAGGHAAIDMAWYHGRTSALEKHCWLYKMADPTAGTEATISFVDARHRPLPLQQGTVEVQVTCTNGDLPAALPAGRELVGDQMAAGYGIRLLCAPTRALDLADQPDSHFDAIAAITANDRAVAQWHLPALLDLLRLHARPDCAIAERQIAGIVGLDRRETVGKLAHEYGASLVYGYEKRTGGKAVHFAR